MKTLEGTLYVGRMGEAREVLVTLDAHDPRAWKAGLMSWFIRAPRQSPAWECYMLLVIHLRDIEGAKPAVLKSAGMTHEFVMYAMDPTLHPRPNDASTWSYLHPVNICQQLALPSDAVAVRLVRRHRVLSEADR